MGYFFKALVNVGFNLWFTCRLATKVGIAGGAVYVAYDSGLLGGSDEGSVALSKAKSAVPPAVDEWTKYFGFEVKSTYKNFGKPVLPVWQLESMHEVNFSLKCSKILHLSFFFGQLVSMACGALWVLQIKENV